MGECVKVVSKGNIGKKRVKEAAIQSCSKECLLQKFRKTYRKILAIEYLLK